MDVSNLKPGDKHYKAYVGPPTQYDFMGATQFRLLCTLGLRSNHFLLDFGCGSLRSGRFFLSYLDDGRYFGIEPNEWLIEDSVNNQIGKDVIILKNPRFDHNSEFRTDVFDQQFDFIIAQSIFSHTGSDLTKTALQNFKESLKPDGLIAVTFVEGHEDTDDIGWVYPGCVSYRRSSIEGLAAEAGLYIIRIPWYHPRQSWFLLSKNKNRLPNKKMLHHLRGAVLLDSEFVESWNIRKRIIGSTIQYLERTLPQTIKNSLKKLIRS